MKAPESIRASYFAPCGLNCKLCYRHLGKKPCGGCFTKDAESPGYCSKCKMRNCTAEQGVSHCYLCKQYPCARVKAFYKRYRDGYGIDLLSDCAIAAKDGVQALLASQLAQYTCKACGGLINLHDGICSECGRHYPLGKGRTQQ